MGMINMVTTTITITTRMTTKTTDKKKGLEKEEEEKVRDTDCEEEGSDEIDRGEAT